MAMFTVATAHGLVGVDGSAAGLDGDITAVSHLDGRWHAVINGTRLVARGDEGSWGASTGIDGPPATCLLATPQGVWLGTEEAHVAVAQGGRVAEVATFDEVSGRGDWYTPWGGPPAVRSLAASATGTLLVNVHVGGIVRTRDGGATWEPTIDIETDVHQVVVDQVTGTVAAALGDAGIAVSRDGGDTWSISAEGMHAGYCRAVAVAGEALLASASDGPFARRGAVYRRPLGNDGAFTRCSVGLPEWFDGNVDTQWLAAAGDDAALVSPDGLLFVSADAGASWVQAAEGLDAVRAVVIER